MIRIDGNLYTVMSRRRRVTLAGVSLLSCCLLLILAFAPGNLGDIAAVFLGAISIYGYALVMLGHYPALRRVHPAVQAAIERHDVPAGVIKHDPVHLTD